MEIFLEAYYVRNARQQIPRPTKALLPCHTHAGLNSSVALMLHVSANRDHRRNLVMEMGRIKRDSLIQKLSYGENGTFEQVPFLPVHPYRLRIREGSQGSSAANTSNPCQVAQRGNESIMHKVAIKYWSCLRLIHKLQSVARPLYRTSVQVAEKA